MVRVSSVLSGHSQTFFLGNKNANKMANIYLKGITVLNTTRTFFLYPVHDTSLHNHYTTFCHEPAVFLNKYFVK